MSAARHGGSYQYKALGCRCEACREGEALRQRRHRAKVKPPTPRSVYLPPQVRLPAADVSGPHPADRCFEMMVGERPGVPCQPHWRDHGGFVRWLEAS